MSFNAHVCFNHNDYESHVSALLLHYAGETYTMLPVKISSQVSIV